MATTHTNKIIEDLNKEYNGCGVSYQGNEDLEPFYARVQKFENINGSIYVVLKDGYGNNHTVSWDEVKDEEFDEDENLTLTNV